MKNINSMEDLKQEITGPRLGWILACQDKPVSHFIQKFIFLHPWNKLLNFCSSDLMKQLILFFYF